MENEPKKTFNLEKKIFVFIFEFFVHMCTSTYIYNDVQ